MAFRSWPAWTSLLLLISFSPVSGGTNYNPILVVTSASQEVASQPSFITAEDLKAKLSKNEAVTIIDVRSANGIDDNKIKGAVYVKLRRLKYRLAFPPLKDVPRNRDVVTYCACPSDEA